MSDNLLITDRDTVRVIQINRPAQANALSAGLVDELSSAVAATADTDTRVLVLRGNKKHFSAGFDLRAGANDDATLTARFLRIGQLLEVIEHCAAVTVACVEGKAVGAGADIALACDYRLASIQATFRFPGSAFGIALGTPRLAELAGQAHALRLAASGTQIDASQARELGIVDQVVDPDTTIGAELDELVRIFASRERQTLQHLLGAVRPRLEPTTLDVLARSLADISDLAQRVRSYAASTTLPTGSHVLEEAHNG